MSEEDESHGNREPTAEQLLASVLAAKKKVLERGEKPTRVHMSREQYRTIRAWHAALGDLPNPSVDYVGEFEILQLEVFDDPSGSLQVE